MQSSGVILTSPVFQNKALVGHAFMQSLHSTPLHVFLSMVMFPSTKNSFTPKEAKSSSLCFFSVFSAVSDKIRKMSTLEGLLGSLSLGICFIFAQIWL